MIRWLRRVFFALPWVGPISVLFLVLMPVMGLGKRLSTYAGGPIDLSDYIVELNNMEHNAGILFLAFISIVYGSARVYAFHPTFDAEYRAWLVRSPFTGRGPLPSGPVHPVWQDAAVFFALTLLGRYYGFGLYPIVACMIAPYCLLQAAAMYANRSRSAAYLICLGIPFLWYFYEHEILRWFVPPILYSISQFKLPRNLRTMIERSAAPTKDSPIETVKIVREAYDRMNTSAGWGGNRVDLPVETLAERFWPYSRLSPRPTVSISRSDAIWFPIVLTWWAASALSLITEDPGLRHVNSNAPWGICFMAVLCVLTTRLSSYLAGYASPISVFGRIATGRCFIAGYDRVFITPVVSIVLALLSTTLLAYCRVPTAFLCTVPSGVALFVLLNFGPSLNTWRLTGAHRLVHGMRSKAGVGYEL